MLSRLFATICSHGNKIEKYMRRTWENRSNHRSIQKFSLCIPLPNAGWACSLYQSWHQESMSRSTCSLIDPLLLRAPSIRTIVRVGVLIFIQIEP
jgi:hypothetical protein